jgi:hypothetical protein
MPVTPTLFQEGALSSDVRNTINTFFTNLTGGLLQVNALVGLNPSNFTVLPTPASATVIPVGPPLVPTVYQITKGSAFLGTLAAPVAGAQSAGGDDGKILYIFSTTAFAHTITATGLFQTGSASVNLATYAAFAGAAITIMALNAKWVVISSVGVTFT